MVLRRVTGMIPTRASCTIHMIPLMTLKGVRDKKGPANCCMQSIVEARKAERGILRSVAEHGYLPWASGGESSLITLSRFVTEA